MTFAAANGYPSGVSVGAAVGLFFGAISINSVLYTRTNVALSSLTTR